MQWNFAFLLLLGAILSIRFERKPPTLHPPKLLGSLLFSKPIPRKDEIFIFHPSQYHIRLIPHLYVYGFYSFAQIENIKKWNKTFSSFWKRKKKKRKKTPRRDEKRERYNRFNRPLFIFIAFTINSINNPAKLKKTWTFFLVLCFSRKDWGKAFFHRCTFAMIEKLFRFLSSRRLSFALLCVYHSFQWSEFAALVEREVICW